MNSKKYQYLLELHSQNVTQKAQVMSELENALTLLEFVLKGETIAPAILVNQIDMGREALQNAIKTLGQ